MPVQKGQQSLSILSGHIMRSAALGAFAFINHARSVTERTLYLQFRLLRIGHDTSLSGRVPWKIIGDRYSGTHPDMTHALESDAESAI